MVILVKTGQDNVDSQSNNVGQRVSGGGGKYKKGKKSTSTKREVPALKEDQKDYYKKNKLI